MSDDEAGAALDDDHDDAPGQEDPETAKQAPAHQLAASSHRREAVPPLEHHDLPEQEEGEHQVHARDHQQDEAERHADEVEERRADDREQHGSARA